MTRCSPEKKKVLFLCNQRVYVGAIFIDDVYVGEDEYSSNYLERQGEDHVTLIIDGDHDNSPQWDEKFTHGDGTGWGDDSGLLDQGTQEYSALPLRRETSHVGLSSLETFFEGEPWWGYPPYGDGGGSVLGENPVVWVTEFYVTPFDRLLRKDPENSLVSDLGAEQVVGFYVYVGDFDEPGTHGPGSKFGREYHVIGIHDVVDIRDIPDDGWMDGILLPANGIDGDDSAVKPDSWARIKASFSQ